MTDTTAAPAAASAAPSVSLAAGVRISGIDMLRGLVIVLMALDHVRDYFHAAAFSVNPLDPAQTTPWLYATRWITHLCAPTFVLLAGVSAYLQFARGKTARQLSVFLLTRGVWLIALELTVLGFGWSFTVPYLLFLQVIWAIGWSMIVLAGLVWLPRGVALAIGVAVVAGHNLLDPVSAEQLGEAGWLWTVLHDGGLLMDGQRPYGLIAYPVLPWAGIAALGYGMGALFAETPARRDRILFLLGLTMLVLFGALRWSGAYGDPLPWTARDSFIATAMDFLDVQKYPPSLQFTLATLGVVFALWPLLARLRGPVASILITFGAVPFFFYVLHIYLVHGLAIAANAAAGRDVSGMFNYLVNGFTGSPLVQGLGFSLPWVCLAWVVVLALLYPFCRWWQGVKARRRDWWLSYL